MSLNEHVLYCIAFDCTLHGCTDHMACDATSGQCFRNCDIFQVDQYLEDCSALPPSNILNITKSLSKRIKLIEDTLDQMMVSIDQTVSAHALANNVDETNVLGNISVTTLSMTFKDLLIAALLIINAFTMVATAVMCCHRSKRPTKYQAVSIDTE